MNALKIFECGLTTHPLLFGTKYCSAVIGGYYKGKSLNRYLGVDLNAMIHLFEASELQRNRLVEKFYNHERVRVTMGALSGTKTLETLKFNEFKRKKELHQGRYGYGGLKEKTGNRVTTNEYDVYPINLKYFLDLQLNPFQNHIHLDIEGAEIDVLESFGKKLKNYTNQVSLELEASINESLITQYIRLHEACHNQFACILIDSEKKELVSLKSYQNILLNKETKGVHVYMVYWRHLDYIQLKTMEENTETIDAIKYKENYGQILENYSLNKKYNDNN